MKRRYIKPETEAFSADWLDYVMDNVTSPSDEMGTTDEGFDAEGRETFLEPEEEETPGIYKRNLWED